MQTKNKVNGLNSGLSNLSKTTFSSTGWDEHKSSRLPKQKTCRTVGSNEVRRRTIAWKTRWGQKAKSFWIWDSFTY